MDVAQKIREGEQIMARRKMQNFATYMSPTYVLVWFHIILAQALDDFRLGKIKRLMVFMPPQHGKSELTSRLFPANCFGHNPSEKILLASYAASVAEKMNREIQNYMTSDEYHDLFPKTNLPKAGTGGKYVCNAEHFDIIDKDGKGQKGYLHVAGVGGGLTSMTADKLIIDDPHKDREQAKSATVSNGVWEWYTDVAKTRIHNDSGILLIQTRWDSEDLAGRLLKVQADAMERGDEDIERWTILCFPSIKISDDNPLDPRKVGDALWPQRHSLSRLREIRSTSPRTFQSLYQQDPQPVQAGGECYVDFDYNTNTGSYIYDPELPLHFSFDFNVNPYMTCTVNQIHKEMIGDDPLYKIVQIAEICARSPHNSTKGICRIIRDRYKMVHNSTTYIYGDPNGMKEDTRAEKGHNDYYIIKQELADFKPTLRVYSKAPSVWTRIQFMNALFANNIPGLQFHIDKRCANTIADYNYIKIDSDGTKKKEKALDQTTGVNSEKYGHPSDANEYFIPWAFDSQYMKYQRGGKVADIVVGARRSIHDAYAPKTKVPYNRWQS